MAITCCYQCPDRTPGCHSKCEKYLQQKAEWEATKIQMRKDAPVTIYPSDFEMLACIHKRRKDKRR
ncbi:MAG: hypothetical protein KBT03_03435 [Bacteroidales bacterium]|nr:hypothetical protein [Candidatus Scybalousia scybalohippi]